MEGEESLEAAAAVSENSKQSRLCSKCSHVNVCSVYRAVAGLINSFETRRPFEPFELAVICKEFSPIYVKAYCEYKPLTRNLK